MCFWPVQDSGVISGFNDTCFCWYSRCNFMGISPDLRCITQQLPDVFLSSVFNAPRWVLQSLRRVNSGPAATTSTKSVSTSSICKWFHADKKDAAPRLFVIEDCDSLIRGWDGGQKRRDWGLQRTTSRSGGARMSSKPFSLTLLHYGQWYLPLELPCREISCVNVNERGR